MRLAGVNESLAEEYDQEAELWRQTLLEVLWSEDVEAFTTLAIRPLDQGSPFPTPSPCSHLPAFSFQPSASRALSTLNPRFISSQLDAACRRLSLPAYASIADLSTCCRAVIPP